MGSVDVFVLSRALDGDFQQQLDSLNGMTFSTNLEDLEALEEQCVAAGIRDNKHTAITVQGTFMPTSPSSPAPIGVSMFCRFASK